MVEFTLERAGANVAGFGGVGKYGAGKCWRGRNVGSWIEILEQIILTTRCHARVQSF